MARKIAILVGTKKGGYILRGDAARKKWQVDGPHFAGGPVYHMVHDPRDGKSMWAAINSTWGGPRIERSRDLGKTWKPVSNPVFREDTGMVLKRTWHIEPGHADQPGVVWAGTEPAALFMTEDGEYWRTIDGLNRHPTRDRWEPGGGGLGLHSIAIDSGDPKHMAIGISAGGAYETTDGGVTWRPWNEATKAKHLPAKEPTVGQCVHKLLAHPAEKGLFFMRNHEGVYWRSTKDKKWTETTKGLPTDYGFAGAVHPQDAKTAYVIPLDSRMRMSMTKATDGGLAVYRTEDRGKTWKRLDKGLPRGMVAEVMREGMSTDALDPAGVYFGTQAGEVWASRDEGRSWERVAQYLPPILSVSAATI